MELQQIIAIAASSSVISAFISGIFSIIQFFMNKKLQKDTLDGSLKLQNNEFKKEDEKEKQAKILNDKIERAKDLYSIIKPALKCSRIYEFLQYPDTSNNWEEILYDKLYNILVDKNIMGCPFIQFKNFLDDLKKAENRCGVGSMEKTHKYFLDIIKNDIEKDTFDFEKRYNIGSYDKVKIDIKKLNNDIEFINTTLNLNIEKFKENDNE